MLNQITRYTPIFKYLKKNKHISILEVWSWSQWIWKYKKIKFTWLDYTTNDYSTHGKKTNKNMTFVEGNALNMPFKDWEFDFVFSLDMIEHIKKNDRIKAFKEIIRVSKKDIIIWFPCGNLAHYFDKLFYETLKTKNKKIPLRLQEHIDNSVPTFNEIKSILSEFNNIKWHYHRNTDINLLFIIMYIETFWGIWWLGISRILSIFVNLLNIWFKNKTWWYHLFIYIEKYK